MSADEIEAFAALREIEAKLTLGGLSALEQRALAARRKRLRNLYGDPPPELPTPRPEAPAQRASKDAPPPISLAEPSQAEPFGTGVPARFVDPPRRLQPIP